MSEIKHIWFDMSNTLLRPNELHDQFLYATYAKAVGKPVSPELIKEYGEMHKKYKSNSAVFTTGLGLPPGYWQDKVQSADFTKMYTLMSPAVPVVLAKLQEKFAVSVFSNMRPKEMLAQIGIDTSWFAHFLSGADFKNPKPALDGFYKMVEITGLPAENILFVGDSVEKEMLPAKKVGMQTALVWQESPEADYSFKKFEDLLTLL